MCTLSFFPKMDGSGRIFTFSRDEMAARSSVDIVREERRGLVYPKDALHGGTWLAFSAQTGRLTCLLNGAFDRHERSLPYRKSRGLILLDSFDFVNILDFYQDYDLENIEPFTLITFEKSQFWEFRWDGHHRHIKPIDPEMPHLWSSATLYNPSVKCEREVWYADYLKNKMPQISAEELWQFHQLPKADAPEKGILMRRLIGPSTVSITQLNFNFLSQLIDFQYHELGKQNVDKLQFAYGTDAVLC